MLSQEDLLGKEMAIHSTTNSVKLSHAMWGQPGQMGHGGEVIQNVVILEKGMATHFSILP